MRAGRLRRRVTLQSPTTSRDAYGDDVPTWSTEFSRWGGVEPLGGSEFWDGQQETAVQSIRVVLRYDTSTATIEPDWRVKYGQKLFDIEYIENVGELDRQLTLTCRYRHLPPLDEDAASGPTADTTAYTADTTSLTADSY